MSYKVTAPLVAVAPDAKSDDLGDSNNGPRYFYEGAVIPDGFNDERCKQLVEEKMLEKVDSKSGDVSDGVPNRSSSKADWVAYATDEARGDDRYTEDEANDATRDELADRFLGPKE